MFRTITAFLSGLVLAACSGGSDGAKEALAAVEAGAVLIDVRSAEEYAGGHLPASLNIPHPQIVAGVADLAVDKSTPIVLYCRSGNRSGIATKSLEDAGYSNVMNAGAYGALQIEWNGAL